MTTFPTLTLDGLAVLFRVGGGPVTVDANGVEWLLTKFDGWVGPPAPRTARVDRPAGPGSFRSVAYRSARVISLEFVAIAPDQATIRLVEDQVAAVASDPARLYELVVTEAGVSRSIMVELDDATLSVPRTWCSTDFSVRVAAPDPRKHDANWQSPLANLGVAGTGGADFTAPGASFAAPGLDFGTPGTVSAATVTNGGTASAYPLFTITGPATNPQVSDALTGVSLQYAGTLATDDVLTINCDEFPTQGYPGHSCYLNSTLNRRANLLIPSEWPSVAPGSSATYSLRATAFTSATVTVSLRSAWH